MYDDQPISYLDRCDLEGVCPGCGESAGCRCDEDATLEADVTAHPAGCCCCVSLDLAADVDLDAEVNRAPPREVWPRPSRPVPHLTASTLRLGSGPRWVESTSIDCGAL